MMLKLPLWYRDQQIRQKAANLVLDLVRENERLWNMLAPKPPENPWSLLTGEDIIRELHPDDYPRAF